MVTLEEIGLMGLFAAALTAEQREQLSLGAADVRLAPGEYAAHDGGERALFAVLAGRIEPVRGVGAIERVAGERRPGDVFGEVPNGYPPGCWTSSTCTSSRSSSARASGCSRASATRSWSRSRWAARAVTHVRYRVVH